MGRFPSWKSPGKQPIKKRGIERFLRNGISPHTKVPNPPALQISLAEAKGKWFPAGGASLNWRPQVPATGARNLRSCRAGRKPISGFRPKSEKNGAKMDFGLTWKIGKESPEKRKNRPKIGKKNPFSGDFSYFPAIFSRFSRWGQNPFSGHFFPISGGNPKPVFSQVGIARSQPETSKVPNVVRSLVAQCSATPASVAATPPCSATPFQRQLDVRHSWPFKGDRCDRAF